MIGLALLSPLVAWLVVDKITDGDRTVKGMVSFGVWSAAILASICWLWGYSGWSRRTRAWVTGGAIAAAAALLFLFPPRWNGAMGISGFRYRFAPTAQQRADEFRAANPPPAVDQAAAAAPPLLAGSGDWPGLLGPQRDGKALDASIRSDWASSPPSTIWRHPVGPGWGGFSVVGDRCFTLEQLGDGETVACYDANTGDPLWSHTEPVRFDFIEPNGGDGPRSTPLFHEGAIYSMGATGLVTCLDARTGDLRWKRALIDDPSKSITWGLSCSPLAVDGAIVVLPGVAAGPGSAAVGLDPATGDTLWASGESRASYSSPVAARIGGVEQILAFEAVGLRGLSVDGETLWSIPWTNQPEVNAAVPIVVGDRVLVSSGYNTGAGLYDIQQSDGGWTAKEAWRTPNRFKLKFNDAVLHDGHFYGLSEGILACIDAATGERRWKRGRYGFGQVLLLGTENGSLVLLITCEDGDLALVAPSPERFEELARYSDATGETLLTGVCWNHAAYSRGRLFWRNGEEAVCIQLADDPRPEPATDAPAEVAAR